MKPNLYRQYLVDRLKIMRSTGEPVEIDWQHLKLKIRPFGEQDCLDGGQAVILKIRSRLHVVILSVKDDIMLFEDGGVTAAPRVIHPKNILAVIEEPCRDILYRKLAEMRKWKREHAGVA